MSEQTEERAAAKRLREAAALERRLLRDEAAAERRLMAAREKLQRAEERLANARERVERRAKRVAGAERALLAAQSARAHATHRPVDEVTEEPVAEADDAVIEEQVAT